MARKRVNTQFLIILGSIVLGLMLTVLLAKKFLIKERPEKYITAGTELATEQKFEDAAKNFRRALMLDPKRADVWVDFGDALNQLSATDPNMLWKAQDAWRNALTVDPNNRMALNRLLSSWSELCDLSPNPEWFDQLRTTATQLAKVDPENAPAQAAIYSSTLRRWLVGVETDQAKIDEAIDKLTKLMVKNPNNPDLPVFIAKAKLFMAERARQRIGADKEVGKLIGEANATVESAVKAAPKNAAVMYGVASQVLEDEYTSTRQQALMKQQSLTLQQGQGISETQKKQLQAELATLTDQANKYLKRKRELLDSARQYATPDDSLYGYIHLDSAVALAQQGDRAGAEKVLRALLEKKPDDQQVRLSLARHIANNGKREEAIAILDRPVSGSGVAGPKGLAIRQWEIQTLFNLTNYRLEGYDDAPTDEKKKEIVQKVQDGIRGLILKEGGDGVRSTFLRGKLQFVQREMIDATQTLERAKQLIEKEKDSDKRFERWQIIELLANCYIQTNQTGRARTLLTELVNGFPTEPVLRINLAQLLIRERESDLARDHIKVLQLQKPDDPAVIRLSIAILDPQTQKPQILELYKKLPETGKKELLDKLNLAMIAQPTDAERIVDRLEKDFPVDPQVSRIALKYYMDREQYDKINALITRMQAKNPDNPDLAIVRQYATTRQSPERSKQIHEAILAKEQDPFRKLMLTAQFAREEGRSDDCINSLKQAEKLKPDDMDVQAQLFNQYLARRQFDLAANYLEPLSRKNQDQVNGLMLRYRFAMGKGDVNSGIEYGRKLVTGWPEFGQSHLALAQALEAAQQYDEALSKYQIALEKQSESALAYRGAIACNYALNRREQAKALILQARKVLPNNDMFVELELEHELKFGKPELAIPKREEDLKKFPDNPNVVLMSGRTYMAAARQRLKDEGSTANFLPFMTKARDLFADGVKRWPDEAMFSAYLAEAEAQRKDLPAAEKALKDLGARPAWKDRAEPLMLLSEFYSKIGRGPEAVKVLQAAIAKAPNNVDVELRLAGVLLDEKKYDEAMKVLQANGEDPRIVRRRIEVLLTAGKLDDADKMLQTALAKMPKIADLRALGGSISLSRNRFEEAMSRCQEGLALDPKHPPSHFYLGQVYMKQLRPDYDAAIQQFNACKDAAGVGTDARLALSECYRIGKNQPDMAIRELEAAQKENPGNRAVILGLLDSYAALKPPRLTDERRVIAEWKGQPDYKADVEILKREAHMHVENHAYTEAAATLGEAIQAAPDDIDLVRQYLGLLLQTQNYPITVTATTKLIEQDNTRWWAYLARGVANRYMQKRDEAIADFQHALDLASGQKNDDAASEVVRTMAKEIGTREVLMRIKDRSDKEPRWALMTAYLNQQDGKVPEAVAALERALAMPDLSRTDKETALRYGGSLYLQVKPRPDVKKAYESYLALLDLSPNDLTALNNMACLLAEVMSPPNPEEGLKYSQRAYSIMQNTNTKEPLVMDTQGWLLVLTNQIDPGIAILNQVVEQVPVPDAHYHLAEAYLKKAYPEEAKQQLEFAAARIKERRENHLPVDPALEAKVQNCMIRTREMIRSKSSANVR